MAIFAKNNPLFKQFDESKKIGDIRVTLQDERVKMIDKHGFDTGNTTTESITKSPNSSWSITLTYSNDKNGIVSNATDMVHALGHIVNGSNENAANEYARKNFTEFKN